MAGAEGVAPDLCGRVPRRDSQQAARSGNERAKRASVFQLGACSDGAFTGDEVGGSAERLATCESVGA